MKINKLLLTAFTGTLFLVSCSSDDDKAAPVHEGAYNNGVFILNEGNFTRGNASVSFLSNDMILENDIYKAVNGESAVLGDVAQDMELNGDYAYIVLNNSHKIEVVNRYTFQKVATISTGLNNPRYITFEDNKAYVTNWGDGYNANDDFVAVIDLATNTVTSAIPVAEGPEAIAEENGKLYVAHAGGYGFGNTISVIDIATNTVAKTIEVGDVPGDMDIENGKLYVLCTGIYSGAAVPETFGELDVINLQTEAVESVKEIAAHPSNFVLEDNSIYYTINTGVYKTALNDALPSQPLFTATDAQGIYSFNVKDNQIYIGDALDYNSNGKVFIYNNSGQLQNTFTVGKIPTGFYFND
jgi:YVTN family beta-propeller protein